MVHHKVNSTQKQLYTVAIVFNISFSIIHDTCDYYQENVYVIVVKEMSKLNFEMKIIIKSFYTNKIVQASRQQMNEVRNKQHNGRIKNAQN